MGVLGQDIQDFPQRVVIKYPNDVLMQQKMKTSAAGTERKTQLPHSNLQLIDHLNLESGLRTEYNPQECFYFSKCTAFQCIFVQENRSNTSNHAKLYKS